MARETCGDNGGRNRAGLPCGEAPLKAARNRRCKFHGGRNATGPSSGTFKHGKYAKYWGKGDGVIERAAANVAAVGDEVLNLNIGVAVFNERLKQLSVRIEEGDVPQFRIRIRDLWAKAKRGDAEAIRGLDATIDRGTEYDAVWDEICDRLMQRGQRAENAIALALKKDEILSRGEVLETLRSIMDAIRATLPEAQCETCGSSREVAVERIRSLTIMPESRRIA